MTIPDTRRRFYHLSRPLLLGIVASCLGILGGIVPDLTQQPSSFFSSSARADVFGDPELANYATVLSLIEPIRKAALAQVSQANSGGTLPNLVCNQPNTMEGLNSEAKSLFVKYCNQCESIAASKGLSIERFNHITQAVRSSPQLQTRVRSLMN